MSLDESTSNAERSATNGAYFDVSALVYDDGGLTTIHCNIDHCAFGASGRCECKCEPCTRAKKRRIVDPLVREFDKLLASQRPDAEVERPSNEEIRIALEDINRMTFAPSEELRHLTQWLTQISKPARVSGNIFEFDEDKAEDDASDIFDFDADEDDE